MYVMRRGIAAAPRVRACVCSSSTSSWWGRGVRCVCCSATRPLLTTAAATAGGSSGAHAYKADDGISSDLGGIGTYAGSITGFVKRDDTTAATAATATAAAATTTSSLPLSLRRGHDGRAAAGATTASSSSGSSSNADATPAATAAAAASPVSADAAEYYRHVSANALTKEEMWSRIRRAHDTTAVAHAQQQQQQSPVLQHGFALAADDVDYLKLCSELKEHDLFHYRLGAMAFPDVQTRRDYYAMWALAMSLNRARWTMLDVHAQRGVKTTGAGVKILFWKEAVYAALEQASLSSSSSADAHTMPMSGQFTDSHPVLRSFAAMLQHRQRRRPQRQQRGGGGGGDTTAGGGGVTRAFVRGFTDARLRVVQQPGNVTQLLEHFDKFYGYFYNTLLEAIGVKDEAAEHMMHHIGRAVGLTTHCVLYWKKYAKLGLTLLPADVCADNCVNVALLQNTTLAARDRAVRRVLYEVLCIAKHEMLQAQRLAKDVTPLAWPVAADCWHTNYYLAFLQRRSYNVSAMFADYNVENPGLWWYYVKKMWQWRQHPHSLALLVDDAAPLPLLGVTAIQRGSKYKVAGSAAVASAANDHVAGHARAAKASPLSAAATATSRCH